MQTKTHIEHNQVPMQGAGQRKLEKAPEVAGLRGIEMSSWLTYRTQLGPLVLGYVQKLVANDAKADKITAMAFQRLWENRQSLSRQEQVLAFLFMAARSEVIYTIRSRK